MWTDNINENVKIDLYKGGSIYYTIISSTPSNGFYLWQIPDTLQAGSDYRVKITSVDFSSISDMSDGNFSLFNQEITITAPNGGESWSAGNDYGITWTDNIVEQVRIELYKGGNFYYTIISSTPSDGFYSWYVPDTSQAGSDYRVKITSVANSSTADLSDSTFTVIGNFITVISPNGGEVWLKGSDYGITWSDNINEFVTIELYKRGTYNYTIVDSTPSDAYYPWTIPNNFASGNDYTIKIKSVDYGSIYDISDSNFTITSTSNVEYINNMIPDEYSLSQNFPNPFNPTTSIIFGLPEFSNVTLKIYDIAGQQVGVFLNNEPLSAGVAKYRFEAGYLSSGIYIYRMTASSNVSDEIFVETKKMILLKEF